MGIIDSAKRTLNRVTGGAKKFGNWLKKQCQDGGNAAGNKVEEWGEELALAVEGSKGGNALAGFFRGVASLVSSAIRVGCELLGTALGGTIKIVVGLGLFDFKMVAEALVDGFMTTVGAGMILGLDAVAVLQLPFQGSRPLSQQELTILKRIFERSLNYGVINIVEGHSGVFQLSGRPFVSGNTIYMKKENYLEEAEMDLDDEGLLVHEATHVWQFQNLGTRHISDAAWDQRRGDNAYDWEYQVKVEKKDDWKDFSREAQAQFLKHLHMYGRQFDRSVSPHGEYPESYDFAGSFFVVPPNENYEPIFAYGGGHMWDIPDASDPNGWQATEWATIDRHTRIALDAVDAVRAGEC